MKKHIKDALKSRTANLKIVVLGILGILLSCHAQKKISPQTAAIEKDSGLTLILQDNYGGNDSTEVLIVKDAKRLQSFFSKINRTRKPGLPVPKIDFDNDMVVIFYGGQQQGTKTPELTLVKETPTTLILNLNRPKNTSGTALIRPFSLYTLPITQKEIILKEE